MQTLSAFFIIWMHFYHFWLLCWWWLDFSHLTSLRLEFEWRRLSLAAIPQICKVYLLSSSIVLFPDYRISTKLYIQHMLENCDCTSLTPIHSFRAQEKCFDPISSLGSGIGILYTENRRYVVVQMKGNREIIYQTWFWHFFDN